MRTVFLVLSGLLCLGFARRVQTQNDRSQISPNGLQTVELEADAGVLGIDSPGNLPLEQASTETQMPSHADDRQPLDALPHLWALNPAALQPGQVAASAAQSRIQQPVVASVAEPDTVIQRPVVAPRADTLQRPVVASEPEPDAGNQRTKNPLPRWATPLAAISSAFAPAIATAATTDTLTNQVGMALGFFNNVRIPATLLAGSALGALFVQLPDTNCKYSRLLRVLYLAFAASTVALELSCVFMSTTMSVRLLAGHFNPMAASAVDFLRREFEFEYIAVRLSFFTGILSFFGFIGFRLWLTFIEKQPYIAKALVFFLLAIASYFGAFWRHTVVNYGGYFSMLARLIKLYCTDFLPKQPFSGGLLIFFLCGATWSFFKGISEFKKGGPQPASED
jgi:hypothetical protein